MTKSFSSHLFYNIKLPVYGDIESAYRDILGKISTYIRTLESPAVWPALHSPAAPSESRRSMSETSFFVFFLVYMCTCHRYPASAFIVVSDIVTFCLCPNHVTISGVFCISYTAGFSVRHIHAHKTNLLLAERSPLCYCRIQPLTKGQSREALHFTM